MGDPTRIVANGKPSPEDAQAWFRQNIGDMPAPTRDMDAREEETDHASQVARAFAESLERSIPERYRWATFSAEAMGQRVKRREAVLEGQRTFREPRVILVGEPGAGKTTIAVAMLRARFLVSREPSLFIPAYRLGQARIQHPAGHGEAPDVLEAMRMRHVLLDDLGVERDTATNPIADVIFERDAENRTIWVTTGFTRAQLASRYGAGLARRLFEHATVIRCSDVPPKTTRPEAG